MSSWRISRLAVGSLLIFFKKRSKCGQLLFCKPLNKRKGSGCGSASHFDAHRPDNSNYQTADAKRPSLLRPFRRSAQSYMARAAIEFAVGLSTPSESQQHSLYPITPTGSLCASPQAPRQDRAGCNSAGAPYPQGWC
jgi:hypothetical protein